MNEYNPERAPEPEAWLELDEQERILLVENYHRPARIKLPNRKAHAVFHVIVENQIAMNLEPVVRAMARLMKEGLTRHDAVHAIGSVVAEHRSTCRFRSRTTIPRQARRALTRPWKDWSHRAG
ncbi:MAG: hypothetical protein WBQ94_24830, partial [Terracidiphilus sp.]